MTDDVADEAAKEPTPDAPAPASPQHGLEGERRDIIADVPVPLRIAAAWAWRIIVVGVVLYALANVIALLGPIVLPLVIAALIAAPLERLVAAMERARIPRTLGSVIAILGLVSAVTMLALAAGTSIVNGFDQLSASAAEGFDQLVDWLVDGPLHVSAEQIDEAASQVMTTVRDNAWGLASGALSVTGTISALVAGVLLAVISLFFILRDGDHMWAFFVRLTPRQARDSIDKAGRLGWTSLRRYTQTSVFVAFIDAVGIGGGAQLLGLPLALPIAIAVFLFSFIPLFGAGISGAIAVLVALVDGGLTTAIWMLVIVLLVQQLEGNILYPWLFGKAASVHPMAILLAVASGTLLAGLAGAVIAVPIMTFVVVFARGLHKEYRVATENDATMTGQIPVLAEKSVNAIKRARERVTTTQIKVRGGTKRRRPRR